METKAEGWKKTHIGCGGGMQLIENLNYGEGKNFLVTDWCEWNLHCTSCGDDLNEEDVEFAREPDTCIENKNTVGGN